MILLKGTLCSSNNFRKAGLIQSCVNLSIQMLCLAILFKVVIEASPHKRGYYVHGHKINKNQETPITHTLINIMFFISIDIIAYLWLIFGLIKKKQMILTGWLLFSVMELIVVQISSFSFAIYITITSCSGASVLGLIIPTLITLYMTYNMCVVYTFRHRLIQEEDTFSFDPKTVLVNPTSISYPQYRIPHTPFVPICNQQASSSCDLRAIVTSNKSNNDSASFAVTPPPYKECNA